MSKKIYQDDISISKIYASAVSVKEIYHSLTHIMTLIAGEINTKLPINRSSRQELNKILELTEVTNQMDLPYIDCTFYPNTK